jgi:hypothetical protein
MADPSPLHHTVLIVPDWVGDPDEPSALRQGPEGVPALLELAKSARVFTVSADGARRGPYPRHGLPDSTPEAAFLGHDPRSLRIAQGPLAISGLAYDVPDTAVSFDLRLLSIDEDGVLGPYVDQIAPAAEEALIEAAKRLETKELKILPGARGLHGLTWEHGSLDLATYPPDDVLGKPLAAHLPEGDGEAKLRRLIDDSINLLTDLEANRELRDSGMPPCNVLWPWGQGTMPSLPRRSDLSTEVWVESASLRLAGLARSMGFRHGDRAALSRPMRPPFARLAQLSRTKPYFIVVLETLSYLRAEHRYDELAWFARQLDQYFLAPLAEDVADRKLKLTILAPRLASEGTGLGMISAPGSGAPTAPFDERALDDIGELPVSIWQAVADALP